MSKSLISNEHRCVRCGSTYNLHRHHIYAGSFRKISERYGCWCYLCANCHVGNKGVHNTTEGQHYWLYLKALCQERFEEIYSHDLFMQNFKRDWRYIYDNYIKQQSTDAL